MGTTPARGGEPWSLDEEERLLSAVLAETPIETLSADFGRTEGALTSRVRKLLPAGDPAKNVGDPMARLRDLVAEDPTYRPAVGIREQLSQRRRARDRSRPYSLVPDIDLVTIAEALFDTMEFQSMQTAAKVFLEVDERQLWFQMVERRADLLVWRSESGLTYQEALSQATRAFDRFRNVRRDGEPNDSSS